MVLGLSELLKQGGEFVGIIFGAAVFFGVSHLKDQLKEKIAKKKFFGVSHVLNRNHNLFEVLVLLRAAIDCDRVELFQFFNGNYYTTGESTLKIHMSYVTVAPGVSFPHGALYQTEGIPVTRATDVLRPLLEKNWYFRYTSDMENSDWHSANLLNGTLQSLIMRVGNSSAMAAVLVCSYTNIQEIEQPTIEIAEEMLPHIGALLQEAQKS